ncbi:hypothetical protein [Brachyspira sp.]|uniref:hypothetical protein n=1 Tax=Brachyspira sp. TaxID=1977261 RepID=UPI00261D0019|nr:hypothetical protein [Brachyspira sp.]
MNEKIHNLIQKNKKFFYIYIITILIVSITLLSLYSLGRIERTGYLSNFSKILDNYYSCRINYYGNKVFRNSDIYGVYPYFKYDNNYLFKQGDDKGTPLGSLVSTKELKEDDKVDVQYKLKLKLPFIMYILAFLILIPLIYFKYIKKDYIILILINTSLYYFILLFILPLFSLINLKFSISDIVFSNLFVIIAYVIFNNKILPISLFILVNIFSFFIIEPMALTFQNTVLLITDIAILYSTLLEVLSVGLKTIIIITTFIYFAVIIYLLVLMSINLIKMNRKKSLLLVCFVFLSCYFIFFKHQNVETWSINFVNYANRCGIINTINLKISYDRNNNEIQSKEEVLQALNILNSYENNRDYSNLILPNVNNKRDIFLIFLESFYDYSHFTNLFDKDPFPEEYRKWSDSSARIVPNTGGGSFYARLAGLTASSPLYPKTQITIIESLLPDIISKNGYYTIALEEAGNTYNLATFLPNIGFKKVIFNLGIKNIAKYVDENIEKMDKPIFVYGFTFLGHTGSHIFNDLNIKQNNEKFFSYFNKKDVGNLVETMDNSVLTAMEIIKTRDIILKYSPNALIIFKHDHLYPYVSGIIENSTIDDNIKNSFLNDNTPTPILIWDGTNGAYKAPVNFVPENIAMFIAINAGVTNYKNSIISLLYKEEIDNTISTYHKYYKITNNTLLLENNISKDSEIYKYENAQEILSKDIFQGNKHYYSLIADINEK